MNKMEKLKLNQLSKAELERRQMNALFGGTITDPSCICNCSSSTMMSDTRIANSRYGYQYSNGGPYGDSCFCSCDNIYVVATTRHMDGIRF